VAAGGWGFSSVVERLPRKRRALGSVPSSEKKNQKKKKSEKEILTGVEFRGGGHLKDRHSQLQINSVKAFQNEPTRKAIQSREKYLFIFMADYRLKRQSWRFLALNSILFSSQPPNTTWYLEDNLICNSQNKLYRPRYILPAL